jgi:flagellar hook-associated protein 3 FlgL
MRISSSTIYTTNVANMNNLEAQIAQTQQQISTGVRILNPAMDPVGAATAIELNQASAVNTQYGTNNTAAQNTLSLSESTLQGVTTLLQSAYTDAVNAGNGTLTTSDRQSLATDLQGQLQQLIGLSNSTDGTGNYLFSGSKGSTQPFVSTAAGVVYQGDSMQRNIQVSPTRQIPTTNPGSDIFMNIRNGNGTFTADPATAAMTLSTNASIDALGTTVSNVANTNALVPGMPISGGSFPPGTTVLAITGPTSFTTTQAATTTGTTGQTIQYGGTNTGTGVISAGAVTNPALYNGNNYQLTFKVAGGVTTYSVTDVSNPAAPVAVAGQTNVAYTSGNAISFNGIQVQVTGAPANGDVFSVSPSSNQSIFSTLSNLINTLKSPAAPGGASFSQSVSDAMVNINQGLNNILSVRASMGARMNELSALQNTGSQLNLQYQQTLSTVQNTDYNQAISDLTQQHTALQAAQQSFAAISKLSLFNYL